MKSKYWLASSFALINYLSICSIFVKANDYKGFDDNILFNFNWPGSDAENLLVLIFT